MKISTNTFIQPLIIKLINPRDQAIIWRLCRKWLCLLHPYLRFLYFNRSGNLKAAEKVSKKFSSGQLHRYKMVYLVKEMVAVLQNGYKPIKPTPCHRKAFNGRVVFALHSSLPWHLAGYAIRTQNLLKYLKNDGMKIKAVTRPGFPWDIEKFSYQYPDASTETVNDISYMRLQDDKLDLHKSEKTYIGGYAELLARLAQQHNAHIIHAASNYLNGLAGAMAARQIGGTSIYEMRGLWHMSKSIVEPGYQGSDHYQYCEIMELAAAQEAHAVVTLSHALKQYLIRKGICESKIHVLSNSVDTNFFFPVKPDQELVQQLGLNGRIVIGFIGSLTGYEGLDLTIKAVNSLIKKGLPLSLVIVGSGYAEKELKKQAEAESAGKNIHFVGQIPFEQIKKYYSIINIFPFPRKDFQVCRIVPPLKILEAMAMQKAVIVSNLAPLMEIVKKNKTGLVCQVNDKDSLVTCIQTLASNQDLRENIGKNALSWVKENRTWQNLSNKYAKLYHTLQ